MALTRAAVVPEAEPGNRTEPSVQEGESHSMETYTVCPSGWTGFSGRCFLYVPTPLSWANAERNCQNRGGNLASVHSFNEHHVIQSMIWRLTHTYPLTWLGGYDATQEGTWFWSDGTPFRFNFWSPGNPNNYRGGQHCLQMNYGDHKKFDDDFCSYSRPFICARKRWCETGELSLRGQLTDSSLSRYQFEFNLAGGGVRLLCKASTVNPQTQESTEERHRRRG
uniref:C-type lectin domain-containing protein n=1 Tax=Lates calcarifer TaxID=8187 RepID=A0A4W6CCG5_LATCA